MALTKKQHDDILKAGYMPPGVPTLVWIVKPVLSLLWRIGFVRRYLAGTAGARISAMSRCQKRGEHDRAADLAIDALKAFRHRKRGRFDDGDAHFFWWSFMRFAVFNLPKCNDPDKWETVIALTRDGMEPFEGYDVAIAFHAFARRKMAVRDYETAVEFATIASRADETWAEPDFLLGWYELASGGGDGMAHLSRAVRKDQKILFRIANDSVCRRHPHVIARLKELSKDGLVAGGSETQAEKGQ